MSYHPKHGIPAASDRYLHRWRPVTDVNEAQGGGGSGLGPARGTHPRNSERTKRMFMSVQFMSMPPAARGRSLYGGALAPGPRPDPPAGGGRQTRKTCSNEHILRSGQRIPPGRIHPPQESSYFRGCGLYLGCHRRNSAKLPKCTRTDTDTTADPLNSRHCFQVLLCPEKT